MIGVLAAAFVVLIPGARASSGVFTRTLRVSGTATLSVRSGAGYIHVSAGKGNAVHVVGHVRPYGRGPEIASGARIEGVVEDPPIRQEGNRIRIGSGEEEGAGLQVDYDITAPKGTRLKVESGSGALRLAGLDGPVEAISGSGRIAVEGFTGRVWLQSGYGDIDAELAGKNVVVAHATQGSIRLDGVNGPLNVETGAGDVAVTGRPTGDWLVQTGYGQVTLNVGQAGFDLDATAVAGLVESEAAIATHGTLREHHIRGRVNGGGAKVEVKTGSGDIRIR